MQYFLRPGKKVLWTVLGLTLGVCCASISPSAMGEGLQPEDLVSQMRMLLHSQSKGYLGVDVADVQPAQAEALHLKDGHGAEITILDHDAPAGKVGLRVHDVILSMNGKDVTNASQFKQRLRAEPAGRRLKLVVNRDGEVQTISVQMADRRKVEQEAKQEITNLNPPVAAQGFLSGGSSAVPPMPGGGFHLWGLGSSFHIGALVEPLTPQMEDFLGVSNGIIVKSVAHRSAADRAGLKAHDVILQVGSDSIATTSDWERLLRASGGKAVPVSILRDRNRETVWLQVNDKN